MQFQVFPKIVLRMFIHWHGIPRLLLRRRSSHLSLVVRFQYGLPAAASVARVEFKLYKSTCQSTMQSQPDSSTLKVNVAGVRCVTSREIQQYMKVIRCAFAVWVLVKSMNSTYKCIPRNLSI